MKGRTFSPEKGQGEGFTLESGHGSSIGIKLQGGGKRLTSGHQVTRYLSFHRGFKNEGNEGRKGVTEYARKKPQVE